MPVSSRKTAAAFCCRNNPVSLLFAEGHAVSALVNSGTHFVGTHQDLIQRAEILVLTMVGTLLDGALDALVGMTVHTKSLL